MASPVINPVSRSEVSNTPFNAAVIKAADGFAFNKWRSAVNIKWIRAMNIKHLLNGVAVAAALAIATPVWAQVAGGNTYGGNTMGLPGPNPGGFPTPSPYDAPGGAYYQVPPRPMPAWNSAMPPAHHAVRHAKAMHAHHKAMAQEAALTGNTAAQLNREELARIEAGAPPAPPPAPMLDPPMSAELMPYQPNPSGGNSMGMPGPNPGGPGLTPYTD